MDDSDAEITKMIEEELDALENQSDLERLQYLCQIYKRSGEKRQKEFIQEVKDIKRRNPDDPEISAAFERFKLVYREEKLEEAEIRNILSREGEYLNAIKNANSVIEVQNILHEFRTYVERYDDKRLSTMGIKMVTFAFLV